MILAEQTDKRSRGESSSVPTEKVQDCLKKALLYLDREMDLPQVSMQYVFLCIPKLAAAILNAVKMKTLDKVFLIPACQEQEPQIILSYGDRMSDRESEQFLFAALQKRKR